MDLTREEALKLHRQMWSDMQNDSGNNPTVAHRHMYKDVWCEKHKPRDVVYNDCFLCDYVKHTMRKKGVLAFSLQCKFCPIAWPTDTGKCWSNRMADGTRIWNEYYLIAPISEILALPEREDV